MALNIFPGHNYGIFFTKELSPDKIPHETISQKKSNPYLRYPSPKQIQVIFLGRFFWRASRLIKTLIHENKSPRKKF